MTLAAGGSSIRLMCGSARCSLWFSAVVLLALASPVVRAQRHEHKRAERAEISVLEELWRRAQLAEDVPEMDHLLSDQFLGVTASGQVVTKVQQLERMRTRAIKITRMDIAETKIKISGGLAVVTSLVHLDGSNDGHPLTGAFRYTRVYQREPGDGWKITNFEATRVPSMAGLYSSGVSAPQASAAKHLGASPSSVPTSQVVPVSLRPQS